MKRTLSLVLVLLMLLTVFTSCADSTKKTTEQPATGSTQPGSESATEGTASPEASPSTPSGSTTPTVTPTPTPTPTPTETPTPSQKEEGEPMTEEEMGVLPVGQYTITPVGGPALSYANEEKDDSKSIDITFGGELNTFTIVYQTWKENPYYLVYAGDDNFHLLAPDTYGYLSETSELVFFGKCRSSGDRSYWDDMSFPYQWHFNQNEDGSYTITNHYQNEMYCLSYKNEKLCVELTNAATGVTKFQLDMVSRGGDGAFLQYISDEGNVTIRVRTDIKRKTKITDALLQTWANNMDDAYLAFWELTSFRARESIVIKAFEPSPHIGYVYSGADYNVITISEDFIVSDLTKMVKRFRLHDVIDWNFCALHEMGHMFDGGRPWYFEAEMMTDLKIPYVLQKYGACAAPSEYGIDDFFYADGVEGHQQIEACYLGLSAGNKPIGQSLEYGAYGAAHKFVVIQRQIDDANWTAFKATFKALNDEYNTSGRAYEKFERFVAKMTEVSGTDIRALFAEDEWNVFMKKYGYTA